MTKMQIGHPDTALITAEDIRKALLEKYAEPEWYLGFEVGNSCGSDCIRHADAVAVNAFPSRGFETRGFEIKVNRADLQRELEDGSKAEAIAKYCNYWFLVVPKDLTKDFMIPEPWGIIEYSKGKLRQKKPAAYSAAVLDPGFMIAFIRGRQRIDKINIESERAQLQENIKKELSHQNAEIRSELNLLKERLKTVKAETGIDISTWFYTQETIKNLKIIEAFQLGRFQDIEFYVQQLIAFADKLKDGNALLLDLTKKKIED